MTDPIASAWDVRRTAMGAFLRSQRKLANMSLRELANASHLSNAYLSQLERGLHDPSLRVLVQIGNVLEVSMEEILGHGGERSRTSAESEEPGGVEAAILADPQLGEAEKEALRAVYRSYVNAHAAAERDASS